MLYVFSWSIPRLLNFISRRFGTLCQFHLHRQVGVEGINLRIVGVSVTLLLICSCYFRANLLPYGYPNNSQMQSFYTYLPMKMEQGVPKRPRIEFRRRGITQKKAYNRKESLSVFCAKDVQKKAYNRKESLSVFCAKDVQKKAYNRKESLSVFCAKDVQKKV